jgi:hypothetical protein
MISTNGGCIIFLYTHRPEFAYRKLQCASSLKLRCKNYDTQTSLELL